MVEAGGWRVAIGPSDHGYQQISYINGCYWTRNGGTHVSSVVTEIASKALQRLHKRLKDPAEVMHSPGRFTSNYMLFMDLTIEHPQFNSVTRDTLLTSKMPSSFRIPEPVLDFLDKEQALRAYR
jgi:DNA gyrase/topoisomerase IV subunit B